MTCSNVNLSKLAEIGQICPISVNFERLTFEQVIAYSESFLFQYYVDLEKVIIHSKLLSDFLRSVRQFWITKDLQEQ